MTARILVGDARAMLRTLPDNSVHVACMSEARINSDEMLFSERVQVEAPADFVPVPLFSEASA